MLSTKNVVRAITGFIVILSTFIWWKTRLYSISPLPELTPQVKILVFSAPVKIYSNDGESICPTYQQTVENKELSSLNDFSPFLIKALLASEDRRFYWHFGVDPIGVFRALGANLRGKGITEGGSTITMQLARTLFWKDPGQESLLQRKFREILISLKIEMLMTKDKILLAYMNRVYLGGGLYGFEAASQFYFGKSAAFLTLEEAATLISIIPKPTEKATVDDRNGVITDMSKLGLIDSESARQSTKKALKFIGSTQKYYNGASYYCDFIIQNELPRIFESTTIAKTGNFIIETSLDVDVQEEIENHLSAFIENEGYQIGVSQGAMVTIDIPSGQILGLSGGKNYREDQEQIDRATQANHQPGSTFKLFTYTAALDKGIRQDTELPCDPIEWTVVQDNEESNYSYSGCERSPGKSTIPLSDALIFSENAPTLFLVKAYLKGLDDVIETAKSFGISSSLDPTPGTIIGGTESSGVSLLEMTGAYNVIANSGQYTPPHGIVRVRDAGAKTCNPDDISTCPVLLDQSQQTGKQVIEPNTASILDNLLRQAIQEGTGTDANIIGIDAAGKTGTTDKGRDLWFIGYVKNYGITTGVWLGNDNNTDTEGTSANAASLWKKYNIDIIQ